LKRVLRARPYFPEEDIRKILGLIETTLRSGHLTMGPVCAEFEARFAAMMGVRHALSVNSGTAALEIVLRCVGVTGRQVIVPTETFVASVNSVLLAGGRPVFAEIHPDTLCLDVDDVERRLTDETAAVMMVHMAGLVPPDMPRLQRICARRGIALIEDAAHAHGAHLDGRRAGSFGIAGCFSFYPTKVMTTAEGGMITTDDDELAARAAMLRNHGANPNGSDYLEVSTNWRMAEPNAAIGLVQLERLEEFVERRNYIAGRYDHALASIEGVSPLPPVPGLRHSYWNYLVLLDPSLDRDRIGLALRRDLGVDAAWPYDPPCHLQPVFRRVLGTAPGDLPVSEAVLERHLALPMHVLLSDDEIDHVVQSLRAVLAEAERSR
jgi:perosamine synthetase